MENDSRASLASVVEIVLIDKLRIEIEAIYLRTCSRYFAASLDKLWMERGGLNAEQQIRPVFKLILEEDPLGDFLVLQKPHSDFPQVSNLDLTEIPCRDDAYYRAFQNLFNIFKHQSPQLVSLSDVKTLVDLADKYDSLPVVSRVVRLHLMESEGKPAELYLQIAKDPATFLSIGEKIRSSIIVKEAAIHVLGTWSASATSCQDLVSDRLFDALAKAAEALRRKKEHANMMLLSLNYEDAISTNPENLNEASLALLMLRDRIGQAFSRCYGHSHPALCEGILYREIASIPDLRKPYISIKRSANASQSISFEEGCSLLKQKIQNALGNLAHCYARVTSTEIGAKYLLCGTLDDADIHWDGEGY